MVDVVRQHVEGAEEPAPADDHVTGAPRRVPGRHQPMWTEPVGAPPVDHEMFRLGADLLRRPEAPVKPASKPASRPEA